MIDLLWILSAAAGLAVFSFLMPLFWDLLRFLPMPFGIVYYEKSQEVSGKADMKGTFFVLGVLWTLALFYAVNYPWEAIYPLFDYLPNHYYCWFLVTGLSTPLVALFLIRIVLSLVFYIHAFYERSETYYACVKTLFLKHLRKKGHIE